MQGIKTWKINVENLRNLLSKRKKMSRTVLKSSHRKIFKNA